MSCADAAEPLVCISEVGASLSHKVFGESNRDEKHAVGEDSRTIYCSFLTISEEGAGEQSGPLVHHLLGDILCLP